MKKLCFYTPPFPHIKSYYDMIDTSVQYGFDALEGFSCLDFAAPDADTAKRIKEYADSKNIKFSCFSAFTRFAAGAENIERLKRYADVASILGSPYLHHTIVGEFADSKKVVPFKKELFADGVQAVREVYDYAESLGVRTVFEEQGYIFNGIKGFGEFLDTVNRDVGVVADFGNIYESEDDLLDFLKAYADKAVHAHIKDVSLSDSRINGCGLETLDGKYMLEAEVGKGIVNFKEAIKILKDAGFNGYYALEYAAKDDNSPVISDTLKFIESLL